MVNPAGSKTNKTNGAVSAFVMKLDQVVNDPETDDVITWKKGPDGKLVEPHCLVVLDKTKFSEVVMPQYFRGSKYCSFIRQLNAYDFSHVGVVNGSDPPAFTHPYFRKDDRSLLSKIERRKQDKRSRATQPEDVKTVKKVEDKIVESVKSTSLLSDADANKYIDAVQTIRDMLASAQMFGMTHLFMERVKEFLKVERKDFSELQDENVLEMLDNIIKSRDPVKAVKEEPASTPTSGMSPSVASTTPSTSTEDDEASINIDPFEFDDKVNFVLDEGEDFDELDVDTLQELLAGNNL